MNAVELPCETFERIFHRRWPGGRSEIVLALLKFYAIEFPAGSAIANLTLQECLEGQ